MVPQAGQVATVINFGIHIYTDLLMVLDGLHRRSNLVTVAKRVL